LRPDAGKVGLELLQPLRGRDIERGERACIDEAADAHAVANLEAGERLLKLAVEHRTRHAAAREIAGHGKLTPDGDDVGAGISEPQRDGSRYCRPAAGSDDLAIPLDALLQRRGGAVADKGHVHAVSGTEPIVELCARLIPPRPLLGARRRRAAGERIERIEDAGC